MTLLALCAAASMTLLVAPAAHAGAPCTIVGTAKANVLHGTRGPDVICGLGGADKVTGAGANDLIRGGSGNDQLQGGPGDDQLVGGPGNDLLIGGAGSDWFNGGPGTNSCAEQGPAGPCPAVPSALSSPGGWTPSAPCCSGSGNAVTGISAYPTVVDASVHDASVSYSASFSGIGITSIEIDIAGPRNQPWRTALLSRVGGGGPLNIPWYYANVTVPAGTAEGTYTVVAARMTDDAGGTHSYAGSELGPQTSFQVIDGAGAPPVLHSFQMSPLHVDTSAAPGLVHYWAHLTDVSGVTSTFPTLTGPGGGTFPGWGLDQGLTSGTAHDGIWEGDFYLPKRAAPGHYRLGGLTAYDLAANEATFGPAEVAALGGPVDVFQDGDGDATPPEVLDFTFAPAPDHPNFFGGTPYAWSAHVQDSDSGVTNGFYSGSVYPVIRDASGQVPLVIQEGPLVSGTDNDATWSGYMTVPDSATPGTYSIELNATDNARNARTLTPGQLRAQGWPSSFDFP